MGVTGRMSLKQQVVLISLLFLIDFSLSEPARCNPQNRECSCADTSSRECEEFFPSERFHVDNIEECMELCQTLNPLGQCEWLLFHYSPAKGELSFIPPYLNCELFAPDDASLEQYVNTCDKQGQPTRRHDGIAEPGAAEGILVIGGNNPPGVSRSVEYWSNSDPSTSCTLEDFPRDMDNQPTANFVAGQL